MKSIIDEAVPAAEPEPPSIGPIRQIVLMFGVTWSEAYDLWRIENLPKRGRRKKNKRERRARRLR